MDFIMSVLAAAFIALVIFLFVTFGMALLTVSLGVVLALALLVTLRNAWRRWRFLRTGERDTRSPLIIEAEYVELPTKKGEE